MNTVMDELEEMRLLFELRRKADQRAITRWQADDPGRALVWPDHTDLVVFLLKKLEDADAQITQTQARRVDDLLRSNSAMRERAMRAERQTETWFRLCAKYLAAWRLERRRSKIRKLPKPPDGTDWQTRAGEFAEAALGNGVEIGKLRFALMAAARRLREGADTFEEYAREHWRKADEAAAADEEEEEAVTRRAKGRRNHDVAVLMALAAANAEDAAE